MDSRPAVRITRTLFATQSMASAALFASVTLASIVGAELSGRPSWAGIPSASQLAGVAVSAFIWGGLMERYGRRPGLLAGAALGILGAVIATVGVVGGAFWILIVGLTLMGASRAATDQGRFAAAEVHPPGRRASALAMVVFGGTVGAIVGPLLVGPSGAWMASLGFSELSGGYLSAVVLMTLATAILFFGLRPEPKLLAEALEAEGPHRTVGESTGRSFSQVLGDPAIVFAMTVMICAQLVMVLIMVITSLYMKAEHHSLSNVSIVISSHTLGMFAFSVVSGRLADRFGRAAVILAGGLTLMGASLAAGLSSDLLPLAASLFFVGFGWNLCYVGGSSLLSDHLRGGERSRTQGLNDTLVGLVSAAGSLSSGFAFAGLGYAAIGQIGALICLIPIFQAVLWMRRGPQALAAS
jgi:MFS family permease